MRLRSSRIKLIKDRTTDPLLGSGAPYRKRSIQTFHFLKTKMWLRRLSISWFGSMRFRIFASTQKTAFSIGWCSSALFSPCAAVFGLSRPQLLNKGSWHHFIASSFNGFEALWQRFRNIFERYCIPWISQHTLRAKISNQTGSCRYWLELFEKCLQEHGTSFMLCNERRGGYFEHLLN